MVGETTMKQGNGSTSTPAPHYGVAQEMRELTHDILSLAELQFELFRRDCREGLRGLLIPVVLLLFAGIVAAGTLPVALIVLAELLAQAGGLSRAAAFAVAAASGLIVAAPLGVVGWYRIRGAATVFERSREELARNMTWIKNVLSSKPMKENHVEHN